LQKNITCLTNRPTGAGNARKLIKREEHLLEERDPEE